MCVEIAQVLGLDAVNVFRLAGYLPMQEANPDTPRQVDLRRLKRKLRRVLDGVPDQHWVLVLVYADVMLDQLAQIALRLDDLTP
jgi:LmbE family N-acetylglucosaminyl deacetylase